MARRAELPEPTDLPDAAVVREALVAWYRRVARDLPWRREVSAYRTLLSELMLQQTRVETVIPYFEAFTARWPTLEAFAAADEEAVLEAWAGLGYYRRARNLLAAARAAVEQGGLTGEVDALRALPGVGPYTAGAIASIAFGTPAAAVDGNVERVVSRVDARRANPRTAAGKRALTARVEALTAPGVASEVTQGLMELGATVCTPKNPTCGDCPWREVCRGRAQGIHETLPALPPRKKPTPVRGVAAIVRGEGGAVLMGRRPPGLLGGLWEPILDHLPDGEAPVEADDALEVLARRAGVEGRAATVVGEVVHVFTHRRLTLTVAVVEAVPQPLGGDGSYEALGWLDPDAPGVGLSKLAQKALATGRRGTPTLF